MAQSGTIQGETLHPMTSGTAAYLHSYYVDIATNMEMTIKGKLEKGLNLEVLWSKQNFELMPNPL